MMDEMRFLLALLLFCLGVYLIWDLFANGFSWAVLLASIICFIATHYVKPTSNRNDDSSSVLDVIEIIFDLPYQAIALLIRGIGKVLKGGADLTDL
jgi:hypothetical protein